MPGIPAWGAVVLAIGACVLGFLVDSLRIGEPGATFAVLYVLGCTLAVVAVRRRGLFAAMVQPPLLMIVAVPVAYQTTGDDAGSSLKDLVLTVAVPLVNRFPLMFLTTMLVLGIGAARLLLDRPHPARARTADRATRTPRTATEKPAARRPEKAARPDTPPRPSRSRAETRRARTDAPAARRMRGTPRDDRAHSANPTTGRRARIDDGRRGDREPRRSAEPRRNPEPPREGRSYRDAPTYREPRPYSEPRPYTDTPTHREPHREPHRETYREPRPYPERRTGAENIAPHPTPRVRYRDREQ